MADHLTHLELALRGSLGGLRSSHVTCPYRLRRRGRTQIGDISRSVRARVPAHSRCTAWLSRSVPTHASATPSLRHSAITRSMTDAAILIGRGHIDIVDVDEVTLLRERGKAVGRNETHGACTLDVNIRIRQSTRQIEDRGNFRP